jgi:hypothetical protein
LEEREEEGEENGYFLSALDYTINDVGIVKVSLSQNIMVYR